MKKIILLLIFSTIFSSEQIYNNSLALIIGINDYQNIGRLNYAANDAKAIKDLLIRKYNFKNENIELILNKDATKQNILKGFNKILLDADENDRVLIFYAGHGETFTLPSGGDKGYLMPVDSFADQLFLTGIPMQTIYEIAEMSYAKHILYLIDACYGGLSISSTRGLGKPQTNENLYLKKITKESGRQVITAGGKEEKVIEKSSWGHSAFTRNLLKGLDEKLADSDNDNIITASELGNFLKKRVTQDSDGAHTPQTGRIGSEEGEFVFLDSEYTSDFVESSDNKQSEDIAWYSNQISSLKNEIEILQRSSTEASNAIELYKPDKPILIILPFESEYHDVPKSIQRKLTDIVSSSLGSIKRFRVVDRNNIRQILQEKKFQASGLTNLDPNEINEIGSILASKEAIQIKGINFGQVGVASDISHMSSYEESQEIKLARIRYGVEKSYKVDTTAFYTNMRTNLLAEVRKINIETGEILDSKTFEVVHEGGIRSESLGKALVKLQNEVSDWIKNKFSLKSTVVEINGNDLVVLAGEDMGVKEGTIYNIQEFETEKIINGQKISIAGKNVGMVKVYSVGKNSSNAKIIQSWGEVKEGQKLSQFNDFVLNLDWYFSAGRTNNNHSDFSLGIKTLLIQKPRLMRAEWSMSVGLVPNKAGSLIPNFQFTPTFRVDYGTTSSIKIYPYFALPLNIAWAVDDLDRNSNNVYLNPYIGLDLNIKKKAGQDYTIIFGYYLTHLGLGWRTEECSYSSQSGEEDCDRVDSFWSDPQKAGLDKRSMFISIGIKNWNINSKFW